MDVSNRCPVAVFTKSIEPRRLTEVLPQNCLHASAAAKRVNSTPRREPEWHAAIRIIAVCRRNPTGLEAGGEVQKADASPSYKGQGLSALVERQEKVFPRAVRGDQAERGWSSPGKSGRAGK